MNELRSTTIQQAHSASARSAILILGMHRSGSSALSGFIHLLGAAAPAHMSRPDDFNKKGYWESSAIREFNDRVLQSAGSDWKDWGPFHFEQTSPKVHDWQLELVELVQQEFGESSLFVAKDPRFCRTAPILLHVLDKLSIAPKILLTVRNPLESAQSLLNRDRMSQEEALLLWLRHVLDAEKASRGYQRSFIAFDDLLDDWREVAHRLAAEFGLIWPGRSATRDAAVDEFLTGSLRHHRIPREELKALEPTLAWVPSVYDTLLDLARGAEPSQEQLAHLDEVRRNFDAATPALRSIIRARDSLVREARDRESAAREQIARLEANVQQVSRRAEAEANAAREQIARLNATLQELSARTERQALEAREQLKRSTQEAESYRSKLEASQAQLAAQKQELDRARSEMEMRVHAVEVENHLSWRELVRTRVALCNALEKGRDRGGLVLWRHLSSKSRMTKAEREQRQANLIRASGIFDTDWYLSRYPDVRNAGTDPVLHYLRHGATEHRDPSPRFSTEAYLRRHLDVASAKVNPLVHFLEYGINEQRQIESASGVPSSAPIVAEPAKWEPVGEGATAEHLKFTRAGPAYEEFDPTILAGTTPDVKLLAFYLPQFHAIPENDRHWGAGFTEWRQIVRGLPRFPGHYQPRVPRDLGFYDLTEPNVMRRQIALAKAAGIHGFGFYYYWFDSHRVLEQPVETFLASPDMDMPFMAIWANENWTRTWDGMSGDILLQQSYDPQHEPALLADLARHFKDPRYIRFGDRPFFVIYQPRHVPDARETFARWRARWKSEFGLEPLIFMAQTFGVEDPREFGLDGAIEFPPHKLTNHLPGRPVPDAFDPTFNGRVVSYDEVAAVSLAESIPAYPLIKTIVPGWDNDARRPMRGTSVEGSTPGKYGRWLAELIARARAKPVLGERIVAINAWNEWAEGAYLEPDLYYGSAYLNATARALLPHAEMKSGQGCRVALVGHDALDFGSQRLLLNIGSILARQFGVHVHFVLLDGGPMRVRYEEVGACTVLTDKGCSSASEVFEGLAAEGFTFGIANTTVTGNLVKQMKLAGFRVVSLVHEMPALIQNYGLEERATTIARDSDVVVFAGQLVRDRFRKICGDITAHAVVKPQGLYRHEIVPDPDAARALRDALRVPPDAKLVLNVGYGDLRKGFDLFTRAAKAVARRRRDVYFVWVGKVLSKEPDIDSRDGGGRDNGTVIAVGHQEDVSRYYAAADVFFLSSREDAYPSVVLEAMAAGLPVVGFAGATGCEELIKAHGTVVPFEDVDAVTDAIGALLSVPADLAQTRAEVRIAEIRSNYDFRDYCFWLLRQFDPALQRISVVVPNYNHERYLGERLGSIFRQSYPVYQVIVLDDASTDGSVFAIKRIAAEHRRDVVLIANDTNGGSLAKQWSAGLAHCTGDFVWIAESDDVADPAFLTECVQALERSSADFCFTDSWQIDADGKRTGESYVRYIDDIEPGRFDRDFEMDGRHFLRRYLSVKNVILNMSGVLWRRSSLEQAMKTAGDELHGFRVAGDWRLYLAACAAGQKIVYLSKALNGHRRHEQSITSSLQKERHAAEIWQLQRLVAKEVEIDEGTRSKAREHLADVRRYLNLPMTPTAAEGEHYPNS